MLRKLFVLVICLAATIASASAQTPPYNEIWYTTTDGQPLYWNSGHCKATGIYLMSDTYSGGRGVLRFEHGGYINYIGEGILDYEDRLKSVKLPSSVSYIDEGAFRGCSSLTSITIPNRCYSIRDGAFAGCSSLKSITIPNSVTSIGYEAFYGCSSLKSITIPNSVTSIEGWAFDDCRSLTSVYCKATTPPVLGPRVFTGNGSGRKIYVPRNSVNAYKSAEGWSDYAWSIVGYDF